MDCAVRPSDPYRYAEHVVEDDQTWFADAEVARQYVIAGLSASEGKIDELLGQRLGSAAHPRRSSIAPPLRRSSSGVGRPVFGIDVDAEGVPLAESLAMQMAL
jgi:hypothetical protein